VKTLHFSRSFVVNLGDGGDPIGLTFVRENGRILAIHVTDVTPYEIVRNLRFDRIRRER
jgi:hypothetical protein